MKNNIFTGEELEKALEKVLKEEAASKSQATLVGMVQPSGEAGSISFTQAGCDTWITIPTHMIEEAEFVGKQTCKEHTHPIMSIRLKEPKNPEARVLYALLVQHTQSWQAQEIYAPELDMMPETADAFPDDSYPGQSYPYKLRVNWGALACAPECLSWGICQTSSGLRYRCCKKWGIPYWCTRGLRPPRF